MKLLLPLILFGLVFLVNNNTARVPPIGGYPIHCPPIYRIGCQYEKMRPIHCKDGARCVTPYHNRCCYRYPRPIRPIPFPFPRPLPPPLLQVTNSSVQEPEESESPSEPKPQLNSQEKPKSPLTQESHSSSTQKPQP
ncbi:hypothetical protein Avbf_11046 [Armadillidium vulgare]|nr:hypothetical protein Avbf_11046 [Armadillidium vulgare]